MVIIDTAATVLLTAGVPDRLVWSGRRWRVTDTPTRLTVTRAELPTAITHAPERTVGWRFQATAEDGETLVVDIVPEGEATTEREKRVLRAIRRLSVGGRPPRPAILAYCLELTPAGLAMIARGLRAKGLWPYQDFA